MKENVEIPVLFLEDNELSLQAVGLLCFLRSYSRNNKVKKTDLYERFPKNKKTSVYNAWSELVRKKYIIEFKTRSKGKWDYQYKFSFKPMGDKLIKEIIETEKGW